MPLASHLKSYSLIDLKVAPIVGGAPGALIDVPGIRSCGVTLTNEATELRGDNRLLAIVDQGGGAEFSLEQGGLDLAVLAVIIGGAVTNTGASPAAVRRLRISDTSARPYFALVGVQPDDGGGQDLHIVLWKCKASGNFEITAGDQEFLTPTIAGRAIGRDSDGALLDLVQHETAIAAALP